MGFDKEQGQFADRLLVIEKVRQEVERTELDSFLVSQQAAFREC